MTLRCNHPGCPFKADDLGVMNEHAKTHHLGRVVSLDSHDTVTPEQMAASQPTLRDRFAMAALSGMLAHPDTYASQAKIAELVYGMADAMLKARGGAQ